MAVSLFLELFAVPLILARHHDSEEAWIPCGVMEMDFEPSLPLDWALQVSDINLLSLNKLTFY
jgi:hypothetical protein